MKENIYMLFSFLLINPIENFNYSFFAKSDANN